MRPQCFTTNFKNTLSLNLLSMNVINASFPTMVASRIAQLLYKMKKSRNSRSLKISDAGHAHLSELRLAKLFARSTEAMLLNINASTAVR